MARTRLMECLSLLGAGAGRSGATALEALAELAAATGLPERAAEYYGARERIARESRMAEEPSASKERSRTLDHLRTELGQERFRAAWGASRDTSYPFEFYAGTAIHWLEGLEARLPAEAPSETPGSTANLIIQVQNGNRSAKERLSARFVGPLRRFAHGRLPDHARGLMDTDDLVLVTMTRGLERIDTIDPKRKGGFFAYMRRILVNQVRDEIRRHSKREKVSINSETIPSGSSSPLDQMIERETLEAYQSAVLKLPVRQREALSLRIDRGCSYQEVADAIGCPSANAARMVVSRGLESVVKSLPWS